MWRLLYPFQVDMAALKQMGDRDLKELGIPMVLIIVSVILFGKLHSQIQLQVAPIHFLKITGYFLGGVGEKAKLLLIILNCSTVATLFSF